MTFKKTVQNNEQFIKELEQYTNDEIMRMMQWVDPQVAYAIGYAIGWKSTGALYDR